MPELNGRVFDGLLKDFHCRDAAAVFQKLGYFAASGPAGFHVVSDFDLTLTSGKHPGQNLGTWDVMDELMPPAGVAQHQAIYNSFRPTELAGKLTEEIAIEKWSETLDLITSHRMKIADIRAAFLAVAELRNGAKSLFNSCHDHGVPIVVLSSGIRNVIEIMAEHYELHPDYILSNALIIDDEGRVSGWRKDTLIHMMNKKEMGHQELSLLRGQRPNVLLLGDVPDDTKMVTGDNVVRIRVLDPRRGETHVLHEALTTSYDAGYDLVTEHSLEPVARIVDWLAGSSH